MQCHNPLLGEVRTKEIVNSSVVLKCHFNHQLKAVTNPVFFPRCHATILRALVSKWSIMRTASNSVHHMIETALVRASTELEKRRQQLYQRGL